MSARETAFEILQQVIYQHKLVTDCYPYLFENVKDERDRRLVVEIVYGVSRYKGRLGHALARKSDPDKTDKRVWLLLLTAVYQLFYLTRIPDYAVIYETVEIAKRRFGKKPGGFVNAVLKGISRDREAIAYPGPENMESYITGSLSFPYWMGLRWISQYGQETAFQIMKSLNLRKPMVFRRFGDTGVLDQEGMFHATPYLPDAVEANLPVYMMRAGNCYVMNESSQLVPELLRNFKGAWVLDAASSPGGKGLILRGWDGIQNVIFNDISRDRMDRILENSRDLNISILTPVCSDTTNPPFRRASMDAVLLDAPCSGTGTLSGHPELRWIRTESDIHNRSRLQSKLIRRSFDLVKPGGVLVYATCSLERDEGEDIVLPFVCDTPEAVLVNPFRYASEDVAAAFGGSLHHNRCLRVLPDKYLDGFFVAMIEKRVP